MIRRIVTTLIALFMVSSIIGAAAQAATLSPTLQYQLGQLADTVSLGTVIVSFNTSNGLQPAHLDVLRSVGIHGGATFPNLGMAGAHATAGQAHALAAYPQVRSGWSDGQLAHFIVPAGQLARRQPNRTNDTFQ